MKRYLICIYLITSVFLVSNSQTFTDSNLPILLINTDGGVNIPDSPRVPGSMKIIYRGEGLRNYLTDVTNPGFLNYDGRINIEVRGSSSQTLQKKQYGFSTLKSDNTTDNNVSLLGMPSDNDWILNGFGFEPSLMRDYLCYNLSRMIGEYASRTVYCEVVINGSYNGLYLLEEKVKQGSERVNIKKMDPQDNSYPKITGGYIVKADKTGGDPVAWTMPSYLGTNYTVNFLNDYPKPEIVSPSQKSYIHNEFEKLQIDVTNRNSSLISGYPTVIDIPSFVDFMIINELGANADAYQYSTYFHKDRNGKLRAGPIWDLNLTFGYDLAIWGFDRSKTNSWQFSNGDNEGPKFWRDLYNNPEFRCCLARRWNQLIQPGQPLNYTTIAALIDKTAAYISEAADRNSKRWAGVDQNIAVWNPAIEIPKIKNFIQDRIPWMTSSIGANTNCPNIITPPLVITRIDYHPDSTLKFPVSEDQEFIEIRNTGSKTIDMTGMYFTGTGFVYQFPAYSEIFPNSSKIIAGNSATFLSKYGHYPFGQFSRNLSDKSEKLVLADGFGNVIDSVRYSDQPPWPAADGNGYFLELTDPLSDNSVGSNWIASSNIILSDRETENSGSLNFYPSPVTDYLTIEFGGMIKSVELYDFQGRMLIRTNADSDVYKLQMSNFSRGMYIVRVYTREGNFIRKIVKN